MYMMQGKIQDSLGSWIPHSGFRIPMTGFQIFSRIPDLAIVSRIRDPTAVFRIPQAKIFKISDSTCENLPHSGIPYMGRSGSNAKARFYERAFATRALATRATSLLKHSRLQIFEPKRDCSQSRLVKCFVIFLVFRFNSNKRITGVNQSSSVRE